MIDIEIDQSVQGLAIAIIEARGVAIGDSSQAVREYCQTVVDRVLKEGPGGGDKRRQEVRSLLRAGGFKPAGRNKPAHEYLWKTVERDGALPAILNVVDLLNAMSLHAGLPISLLSVDRLGAASLFRYGREGESFVFNRSGQEMSLAGLICWCSQNEGGSAPLGSPVKDSMAGKVTEDDSHIAVCIYAPADVVAANKLDAWANELGYRFVELCGAGTYEVALLPPPQTNE